MRVERIMCPIDFSTSSDAALDDAASLAKQLGAQLLIVHVDEHPLPTSAAPSSLAERLAGERVKLAESGPHVSGIVIERHLVCGKAADEIPRFARDHNVDLVVMARQHEAERFHAAHDGLCAAASRRCPCPVMTVRRCLTASAWMG